MQIQSISLSDSLILTLLTLVIYQSAAWAQQKSKFIWLNPLLVTIIVLIPFLLLSKIPYANYRLSTHFLNALLEPAIVALGYPLYLQLQHIKRNWKLLVAILVLGVILVVTLSFSLTMLLIHQKEIAIALSLKSVTTPVGIIITEQLQGDSSITPFAIIIAGFAGGLLGPSWLRFLKIRSDIAAGLSIGAASHVIGSMIISKDNPYQGAYSSVALIICAVLTAFIMPLLMPILSVFFA